MTMSDTTQDEWEIEEEWIPMKDAARRLKISYNKLARLAAQGDIRTQDDVLDKRVKLVEINQVKRVFRV